ncbi:MAG TPA: flavodoxin domain-containing protein [Phycisphaerae bacterium]|nr:flavodoxin domain-containing protein [Phycisphaerae bacterium]
MTDAFQAVRVTDRVYWVGARDWEVREFHGYRTSRGTTYNAFLVLADKVTLVDTVKKPFRREMLARVASVVDPKRINYIISNHSEMDHSGSLPETIAAVKPEKVFASANGVRALEAHFHMGGGIEAVKTGDTRSLGNMNVTFVETKMLHWPDSMVSYLAEEKILFSQDAFGQHLASQALWADEVPQEILYEEAAKYYANILLPFSPLVAKTVPALKAMNLALEVLAPDHGPLYRKDLGWIMDLYEKWAAQKPTRKALVVFDTMWESDSLMAEAVAEGLAAGGAAPVKVLPMRSAHRSDVAAEILEAGALVVGSPTINNQIFPTMADVLCYLEGLKPKNLLGAAFGSYGWSGEAVGKLEEWLQRMGVRLVAEGVKVQYVPDSEALAQCQALGEKVGEELRKASGDG